MRHDVTHFIYVDGPLDAVLHFASPASPIDYLELPIQTLKVGSLGTHNALGLALEKKARFLLASTSEVYGDPLVHPQPETYWGNVNPIGPARRLRRGQALRRGDHDGVPPRPRRGHPDRPHLQHVRRRACAPATAASFRRFIGQALAGEPMTVFGDGSQTRSFCYVSDLIDGIYRLLQSDVADPMNIGNPAELTVLEFARTIRALTGTSERDRLQAAAGRRSEGPTAGHHEGEDAARLGAEGETPGRAGPDDRILQETLAVSDRLQPSAPSLPIASTGHESMASWHCAFSSAVSG